MNKICRNNLKRCMHTTLVYKNVRVVNPYLLNRSIPASDILKSLKEEDLEQLKIIKTNYNYLLVNTTSVPSHLTDENYLDLLCLTDIQGRKYLLKLAKKELAMRKKLNKGALTSKCNDNEKSVISNRFYSKYLKDDLISLNRLYQAINLKSQEVVIDLSYEDMMNLNNLRYLANDIVQTYGCNKDLRDPFQLVFSGLNPGTLTYSAISRSFNLPTKCASRLEHLPFIISGKHYFDLFPNRRFVYLSSDSTNYFNAGEYDHEAVYIIGGIIEKSKELPLTLGRARYENIEHRAFPIDRYIDWKSGSKSLGIANSFRILATAQKTNGDWEAALKEHISKKHCVNLSDKKIEKKKQEILNRN